MKTLSGCKAPRCHKHQFCDRMTVSTWTIFEMLLLNFVVLTRKKNEKNGTLATAHFCIYLSSAWLLSTYMSLADHKATQSYLNKHLMKVQKLYGFCLSIAYIVRLCHPYIESLPTLWYVHKGIFIAWWSIKLFSTLPGCCPLHRTPFSNVVRMCTRNLVPKPKPTVIGLGVRLVHRWLAQSLLVVVAKAYAVVKGQPLCT